MHRSDDQLDLDARERACVNLPFSHHFQSQCGSKLTSPPHQLHTLWSPYPLCILTPLSSRKAARSCVWCVIATGSESLLLNTSSHSWNRGYHSGQAWWRLWWYVCAARWVSIYSSHKGKFGHVIVPHESLSKASQFVGDLAAPSFFLARA